MKIDIINICDKISSNEEISQQEYNTLVWYLHKCNQDKSWNTDDVISEFLLDVRLNYDKNKQLKQKEAWIYAHIKWAIQKIAIFDTTGTLNNPVPISLDGWEVEDDLTPCDLSQEVIDEFILWIDWLLQPGLERDIYENCIKGNTPVVYITREYWKSAERGRIIKQRIFAKIRKLIENMPE